MKSMTGFGAASCGAISVEASLVNGRQLEILFRAPKSFSKYEELSRAEIKKHIKRGKLDLLISIDQTKHFETIKLNSAAIEGYLAAASRLNNEYGIKNDLTASVLLSLPDIISPTDRRPPDLSTEAITSAVGGAVSALDQLRRAEGQRLTEDLVAKAATIERLTEQIKAKSAVSVGKYRQKLEAKMREALADIQHDESRLLSEVRVYADRVCCDEELVRLESHITLLRSFFQSDEPVGRKIEFLCQELLREANTIGSKCQEADISHLVVELKNEIEKVREQACNIE